MTHAYLSLGSNIDKDANIRAALLALQERFGMLQLSPVYESKAVGFDGDNFLNLIVRLDCDLSLPAFAESLKQLEQELGRERSAVRFSSRTMDIDIVLFGDLVICSQDIELPRPELYFNAFVLRPMAELAPQLVDPKSGKTMQELYALLDKEQDLWEVPFSF